MSGKTLLAGFLISFVGSLPLGVVNIALLQVSAQEGVLPAILFAIGSLIAEVIYIGGTLFLLEKIWKRPDVITSIKWVSFFVLVGFSVAAFIAAFNESHYPYTIDDQRSALVTGFLLMAVNPMQIVFWGGWATILLDKKIMQSSNRSFHVFTYGAAVGAMIASLVFIIGGQIFEEIFTPGNQYIYIGIGIILLSTAAYQFYSMIKKGPKRYSLKRNSNTPV